MATAEAVGDVQGVAAPAVALSFAHLAGAEGVAACVRMHVVVEQAAAVEVQLSRALPVGRKLGAQQWVMARGPGRETTVMKLYKMSRVDWVKH